MDRGLSVVFLQKALADEVKRITEDMSFLRSAKSDEKYKLEVYQQSLPIPKHDDTSDGENITDTIDYVAGEEEEPIFKCPWAIVKVDSGKVPEINGRHTVSTIVQFGIFNDANDNSGHIEILNLIERVYQRFARKPLLDKQYLCQGNIEWALQAEDTYPYFFGAIIMDFSFAGIRREDDFI